MRAITFRNKPSNLVFVSPSIAHDVGGCSSHTPEFISFTSEWAYGSGNMSFWIRMGSFFISFQHAYSVFMDPQMFSSTGQSPCDVALELASVCYDERVFGSFSVL